MVGWKFKHSPKTNSLPSHGHVSGRAVSLWECSVDKSSFNSNTSCHASLHEPNLEFVSYCQTTSHKCFKGDVHLLLSWLHLHVTQKKRPPVFH